VRRTAAVLAIILVACVALLMLDCRGGTAPKRPAGSMRGPYDPSPLLGKPAPAFVTVDQNGSTVDLKTYLGKNVILLDFWATWCGPCIMAMPQVASVADKYEDRGLVFFTVNERQDPDTVKEFLANMELDLPVAMDFDGKIQKAYLGPGLPHTVIIGKDGTVQVDHVGYSAALAELLSADIEQLLDGKNVADVEAK
jgi:thiol-disulfide isomerase/thioredoxin